MAVGYELPINTSASAMQMAQAMFGGGIDVRSAQYFGDAASSGVFSDGLATAPGVVPSDSGVILSTGRADSFTRSSGDPNRSESTTTNTAGVDRDKDFDAIAGQKTYDASFIEADFVPEGDTLSMQVVFSSEEYLEYVNSGFNDAVGIWVNGVKAELTVGSGDVSIDNINPGSNSNLYVDNPRSDDTYNTEMDGFTVTLTLKAPVNAGEVNHIKIGIADAGDAAWDSNLLIKGDSIQTAVIAGDDTLEIGPNQSQILDVLANDEDADGGTLTITHVNGQAVVAGSVVTLPTGEMITVNGDGTFTVDSDGDIGSNVFSYTVADDDGNTDTAFVTVDTVPCFVAGTRIDTARGPLPVESLEAGDLVLTRDNGFQPLRWKGVCRLDRAEDHAPFTMNAGVFGGHGTISVSPQHRVLITGLWPALCTGADEVLIPAHMLARMPGVTRGRRGDPVTYVHLLFDRHEVLCSDGLWSESFYPGGVGCNAMGAGAKAEIWALFPHIAVNLSAYGPAARQIPRSAPARAVAAGLAAHPITASA